MLSSILRSMFTIQHRLCLNLISQTINSNLILSIANNKLLLTIEIHKTESSGEIQFELKLKIVPTV